MAGGTNSETVSEFGSETFADRIRALIGEGSANAFAKECKVGGTSIRQYLEGGVPGLDKVIQIARAKNVGVEWLATGEGPRSPQPEAALSSDRTKAELEGGRSMRVFNGEEQIDAASKGMVLLPRLSVLASAGEGIVPVDEDIEDFLAIKEEALRELGINPRNAHVLMIRGNSMYPTLHDRDVIIVDASIITVPDEGLYTLVLGDAVRAKRVQPLNTGGVKIISDNKLEGYADEIVPPSELHTLKIVGRVRAVYRSF